jgi:hypothetical protein
MNAVAGLAGGPGSSTRLVGAPQVKWLYPGLQGEIQFNTYITVVDIRHVEAHRAGMQTTARQLVVHN